METQLSFTDEMRHIQDIAKKSKLEAAALFDEKLQKRIDEEKEKAKPIIAEIHGKARKAAADDKSGCEIMRLKEGEKDGFSDYNGKDVVQGKGKAFTREGNTIPLEKLGVKARAVAEYCTKTLRVGTYVKEMLTSMDERGERYYILWISWEPMNLPR